MKSRGMTLIETMVVALLGAVIIAVSSACLMPAYQNFRKSQQESMLVSSVQLALLALQNELRYSEVGGCVIIPSTYTHPETGKTCQCYALAFPSILRQDGTYEWDENGNPYWVKDCIIYLDTASGSLYCQNNYLPSPSITCKKSTGTFTPRHGSGADRDRLIARNVGSVFFTDATKASGITSPAGDYVRTVITGVSREKEFTMEASIYARLSR
ncbi:MAG: prepilin-type N-terminal cleavage/methylation domain-containing protein [Candidatus Eremiobacteraeota bacterium]|nr:prepilin-type N-terminal cleavage/methylation domain-containing protein [Candidatus Eremiobacteraeota bacterium]